MKLEGTVNSFGGDRASCTPVALLTAITNSLNHEGLRKSFLLRMVASVQSLALASKFLSKLRSSKVGEGSRVNDDGKSAVRQLCRAVKSGRRALWSPVQNG